MAIIIILLLINVIQLFLQNQSRKENAEQAQVITNQEAEIKIYGYKVDSIQHELEDRYREIARLGGDTASMGQLIRQLKKEKKGLSANLAAVQAKYNELKSQFDAIMQAKDKEIITLREERDNLFRENNDLKRKQVTLTDSMSQLKVKKDELSKQVAQASVLKAANMKVTFLRKGKEVDASEYKAKRVEKVKIVFDVLENKVAKIGEKSFYLRLIEPDGAAIYDLNTGGGSITVDGQEVYYAAKQDILYDGNSKSLTFVYGKGSAYKPGRHTVEIYCEGGMIGRGTFNLK